MNRLRYALILCSFIAWGQTQIDLKTQSRNVDFSAAASTKPAQTGTSLPAACDIGQVFFSTAAAAGSNLYVCTAANTWTQNGGSGAGSINVATASISGSAATLFANCTASQLPCNVNQGQTTVYQISAVNTMTAPTSGTGSAYVYLLNSTCVVETLAGVDILITGGGPCAGHSTQATSLTWPANSVPIAILGYAAGNWTPVGSGSTNYQPSLGAPTNITSTGGTLIVSNSPTGTNLEINTAPSTFASYPACDSSHEGTFAAVTDSTTNTWGATVTGGGANHIKMYCDGASWTVEAK